MRIRQIILGGAAFLFGSALLLAQEANKFYPMNHGETWESHTGLWACPNYGNDPEKIIPINIRTYATCDAVTDGVALRADIKKGSLGIITYENSAFIAGTAGLTLYVKGSDEFEMSILGKSGSKFKVTKEWQKIDLPWEKLRAVKEKPILGWQWDIRLAQPAEKDLWVIIDRVGCEGPNFMPAITVPASKPDETINTKDIVGNEKTLAPALEKLKGKQPFKIIAFGDSVTAGAQVTRGNWGIKPEAAIKMLFFSHLARLLNERYGYSGVTWVQKGHGGWTAGAAKGVVATEIVPLISPEDVVIIEFGANDLSYTSGKAAVDAWIANTKAMVTAVKAKTSQVIIMSPTTLGKIADPENAKLISQGLRDLAALENVAFVDITKWSTYRGPKFAWAYEANAAHPSLMGHVMMAEIMETLFGAPHFDWPEYVKK